VLLSRLLTSVFDALENGNCQRLWALQKVKEQRRTLDKLSEQARRLNAEVKDLSKVNDELQDAEYRSTQAKATRAFLRWIHRASFCAFKAWHQYTAHHVRIAYTMAKIVLRMQHQETSAAFETWCTTVDRSYDRKQEEKRAAEAARRIEMCQRVVRRMLNNQLAAAWASFVDCIAAVKDNRAAVRKAVGRMHNRTAAAAFDRYAGAVDAIASHRAKVQATIAKWKCPALKQGFALWCDYMEICREEQAEAAHELAKQELAEAAAQTQAHAKAEAARRIAMCKGVVQRMLRQQLAKAFNAFVDCIYTSKENRDAVRRVLCRMQHRALAGAFAGYAGAVDALVAQRERVNTTLARWKNPRAKKAMEMWQSYLDICQEERAEEAKELVRQQMQEAADEQLTKLQNEQQQLNIAILQQKAAAAAEAERRIAMCKRVVQRLLHQQLAAAWSSFVDCVLAAKEARATVSRVLARMRHRQLAAAWDRFSGVVAATVAQRNKLRRTMAQW